MYKRVCIILTEDLEVVTMFTFSRCVCLQVPDLDKAVAFYTETMGFKISSEKENTAELKAGPFRLFLDKGEFLGPIMEFLVPDAEAAKQKLLKAGCRIVLWEGKGNRCYMKDPFGVVFNLYEEPEAFKEPE